VLKYSLVTFVCCGFWLAVLFQFLYYRFLHPSHHVRLSTKRNISSFVNIRTLPRIERIKKSKSCEEMITQSDRRISHEDNDLIETTSLHLDTSIDERWHNRFSLANRQKLISQQQAIDHKVKLTRAQKQSEDATKRLNKPSHGFLTKISTTLNRPTAVKTSLVKQTSDNKSSIMKDFYTEMHQDDEDIDKPSLGYITEKRPPQHQQQPKMYNINEDTHLEDYQNSTASRTNNTTAEGGDEMILTAAKLASHIMPLPPSSSDSNNKISPSTTNPSLC
jgi:hypothetical protein